MSDLEERLDVYLDLDVITVDNITDNGSIAVDQARIPNGRQNSIGALVRREAELGHIVSTGRSVKSKAPYGKGRRIQVWQVTDAGRRWAENRKRRLL